MVTQGNADGTGEPATQVVVDDVLGLPGRGVARQDTGAQARGHGQQAEGLQVRVQAGGCAASRLGRPQLGGDHVDYRG
jgi:hypothetical protein